MDQPLIESLFSGIGGLDLAVERVFGARCWVHVEQEPYQRAVLARHWPDAEQYTDVCAYRGQGAQIVCGGFPCQNISALGDQTGLKGAKSGLWREFARIIGESEPDCVIIENVKDPAGSPKSLATLHASGMLVHGLLSKLTPPVSTSSVPVSSCWPSPTVSDDHGARQLVMVLNPEFIEELEGLPTGWTSIGDALAFEALRALGHQNA